MAIRYRTAAASDAPQLLEYLKTVGGETDNLTFGAEGIPFTAEQEAALLERIAASADSRFFLALDGEKIVGNACVDGMRNARLRHRRNFAITVLRDYWGRGIGTGLMERMIAFARTSGAELASLEVRTDNERAKALYRKFGFVTFGTFPKFFKIDGKFFDVDCMTLDLHACLTVVIDRPLGSRHPEYPELVYPVNYGHVPGLPAPDGEEQDVYVLGVDHPLKVFAGRKIAVIRRADDVEEKWVAAPEGMRFTAEEILEAVRFQERYFRSEVVLCE